MGRYNKLGKNVAWMTIGNFASKLLSFFLIPLYTSVLTTEEYGISDIIATTVTLLSPILTLQISEAVMRFSLDSDVDDKQTFTFGILTIIVGFVVLLILSPALCFIKPIQRFYSLFILYYLGCTLNTMLSQYAKGINLVHYYAISGIIHTASVIVCNILLLLVFKCGIKGYIISLVVGSWVSIVYLFVQGQFYKKIISLKNVDFKVFMGMLKYSIPMIPNSLSWWVSNSSDKYMLNYMSGTSSVGVYSIAYKIPSLLSTINTIFMSAWQISAVDDFGSIQSAEFFSNIYKNLTAMDAIVVSALIAFSKIIAKVLYAKDFYVAWKYAVILCFAFYFSSLSSFLGSIYTTSKKTNALFYTSVIGAAINIVVNLALIPAYGAFGAAIATLVSYFVIWIIRFFHVDHIFRFEKYLTRSAILSVILIIQMFLIYSDSKLNDLFSYVCLLAIAIMNKGTLQTIVVLVVNKIKSHKNR